MKAVIVCIAPDIESLKKVVPFIHENNLYFDRKQVLYYRLFDNKRSANAYFALDLVAPDFMCAERENLIIAGKLNEFNAECVNLSIRTGGAMVNILLLSDKPYYLHIKLGLIPFGGVSPLSLFCCYHTN